MELTSAAINKMLKSLQDDKEYILRNEQESFVYDEVEGFEPVVPPYDFEQTNKYIEEIDVKVAKLKHALNVMNATAKLRNFDMTLDEALVRMAQLNKRLATLDKMRKRIPKKRKTHRYGESSSLVDYECANYDIQAAKDEYKRVQQEIMDMQMDIDYINQTRKVAVDV